MLCKVFLFIISLSISLLALPTTTPTNTSLTVQTKVKLTSSTSSVLPTSSTRAQKLTDKLVSSSQTTLSSTRKTSFTSSLTSTISPSTVTPKKESDKPSNTVEPTGPGKKRTKKAITFTSTPSSNARIDEGDDDDDDEILDSPVAKVPPIITSPTNIPSTPVSIAKPPSSTRPRPSPPLATEKPSPPTSTASRPRPKPNTNRRIDDEDDNDDVLLDDVKSPPSTGTTNLNEAVENLPKKPVVGPSSAVPSSTTPLSPKPPSSTGSRPVSSSTKPSSSFSSSPSPLPPVDNGEILRTETSRNSNTVPENTLFDHLNFTDVQLAPTNRINDSAVNVNTLDKPSCGNGFCELGETCANCPLDCGSLVSSYVVRCDLGIQRCVDNPTNLKSVVVKVVPNPDLPSPTNVLEQVPAKYQSSVVASDLKREFLPFLQPFQDLNMLKQHPGLRSFSYIGFHNNVSSALEFFTKEGFSVVPIDQCLFGRSGPYLQWEDAFHFPL